MVRPSTRSTVNESSSTRTFRARTSRVSNTWVLYLFRVGVPPSARSRRLRRVEARSGFPGTLAVRFQRDGGHAGAVGRWARSSANRKVGGSFSREVFEIREMGLRKYGFHKVITICVLTAWQLAACLTRPQAHLRHTHTPLVSNIISAAHIQPNIRSTATLTLTATPTPTPVHLLGELEENRRTAYSLVATEYKTLNSRVSPAGLR
jgi:hypothetical protein